MNRTFLDELTVRHQEASRAFQIAQAELQASQNRFNIATQKVNALAVIIREEQQRVALEAAAEAARQPKLAIMDVSATASPTEAPSETLPTTAPEPAPEPEDLNKTDLIRTVLSQHPKGITANEIWKELKNSQISNAYVHSVLHRLKKRGQVSRRLGKYVLKSPQPEEVAAQNGLVETN